MADITSATDYVPMPANPNPYASLPGGGPLTAANGNLGALQGALYKASVPMMAQDDIDEVKDTLFSRVRSPEDIAAAKTARRGALSALQEANTGVENDWSGDRYIAYGMAANDKPWDVTHGVQKGIALAMGADLEKQGKKYKAGVSNAATGLEFEQNEEKIDDKIEGTSLGNLTQMANAQSRINMATAKGAGGAGGMGGRWKPVKDVGLVDTWAVDPVTGESKPQVVVKAPVLAQMFQKNLAIAAKEAASEKDPLDFVGPDGKPSLEVRNAWIRKRANELMEAGMLEHVDPQAKPDYSGMFVSPPPGGQPAGAPAAAGSAANPTGGKERNLRGFANMGELKGAEANDPSVLPGIPVVDEIVKRNNADIAQLDAVIADPKVPQDAKIDAERTKQKLIAANRQALKNDISGIRVPDVATRVPPVAPAPKVVEPSSAVPGVSMGVEAEVKRGNKFAETQGSKVAELNSKQYHEPAAAAEGTLSTVKQLRGVPFTPGAFNNQKKFIGNALEAFGIKGSLITEASNIENASKLIAQEVNSKVRAEVGVQTDSDVTRQAAESAKITDPKASFQFSLNQMEENAKRKIARSAFVKQMEAQPGAATKDMRGAWLEHAEKTYGPALQSYNGRPTFRSEFIDQAIKANPDMDPKEAEAAASQAWLGMNKGKK